MGLKKIVLPATVTTIDANAFENCSSLTTLGIGAATDNVVDLSKVTTVGTTAFGNCSAIKTIEFGKYSTRSTKLELKGQAFVNCTSLQKVEIPIQDALKMGTGAFENCSGLMEVGLEEGLQYIGNSVFKGAGADILCYWRGNQRLLLSSKDNNLYRRQCISGKLYQEDGFVFLYKIDEN